ncbi:MAG: acyl-CoA dehydrogenase family protein [Hyphomicrobiaceae bacterium]
MATLDMLGERLLDLVRESGDEIDRQRQLPDAIVDALHGSRLNRCYIPVALGGSEARMLDVMEVIERIAAADGSAGWCAAIGSGSNIFAGYLPRAGAETIFADPDQASATMFAPCGRVTLVRGKALLNGQWPFASNCLHSAWTGLGALFETPNGLDPIPRVAFVPTCELEIEDTWDAVGLRGTGSHHVAAKNVAIQMERCARFSDSPWPDGPLWRLPIYSVLYPTLVASLLGIARGALDEVARQARKGRTARRGQLTDAPVSMAEYALADTRLRAARAGLREAVGKAQSNAKRGKPITQKLQAQIFLSGLQAADVSVEVALSAYHLGGGAAVYRGSKLLRALCDVQTGRQHLLFSHHHLAELGKLAAGLEGVYPPYIV